MNRFLKLIGFLGLLLAFLAASSLVGLSYAHYHHPVQMLMVVGMTTAAMLCTFGAHCLGFMAKGVVSVFQEVAPNPRYAMLALAGRRYSLAAGVIAMIQGLVVALASIASDSERISPINLQDHSLDSPMVSSFQPLFAVTFIMHSPTRTNEHSPPGGALRKHQRSDSRPNRIAQINKSRN